MCEDSVLLAMLSFLEKDIENHPERLRPPPADLVREMIALTQETTFDPDEAIEGDVDL